jgi:hypothetical protein
MQVQWGQLDLRVLKEMQEQQALRAFKAMLDHLDLRVLKEMQE